MKTNIAQKISVWCMALLFIFWCVLSFVHTTSSFYNYVFSFCLSFMPLIGGLVAMFGSKRWKGLQGFVGKGIFFLGLGIFCWGFGELIWSYYNFFQSVAVPYPSLADIGFAPSVFFYCIGSVYLARAAGADFGLKHAYTKIMIIAAPIVMFIVSYYLLVIVARQGVLFNVHDSFLKTFLDIAYPVGDFISLTLAVVISGLSFTFLTKEYKWAIISILFGIGFVFVSDMIFSYTTTRGTYFNGDIGDLLFGIAMFFFTFGVLGFSGPKTKGEDETLHVFKFLWYR